MVGAWRGGKRRLDGRTVALGGGADRRRSERAMGDAEVRGLVAGGDTRGRGRRRGRATAADAAVAAAVTATAVAAAAAAATATATARR